MTTKFHEISSVFVHTERFNDGSGHSNDEFTSQLVCLIWCDWIKLGGMHNVYYTDNLLYNTVY